MTFSVDHSLCNVVTDDVLPVTLEVDQDLVYVSTNGVLPVTLEVDHKVYRTIASDPGSGPQSVPDHCSRFRMMQLRTNRLTAK